VFRQTPSPQWADLLIQGLKLIAFAVSDFIGVAGFGKGFCCDPNV
jgi:hypothetical protein